MAKLVRYNGGKDSYYGCSNPDKLDVGKMYEVLSEEDRGWQTDYTLRVVDGQFSSVWFDEVERTFMAVSRQVPIIGQRYDVYRLDIINGQIQFKGWTTSVVKEIRDMGNHIYEVITHNSTYIVQVH